MLSIITETINVLAEVFIIQVYLSKIMTFKAELKQLKGIPGESKTYTHDGYTVEYTVKNEWTGNQNIEVTITNTGEDILSGWAMGYNAFGEIGGLWNAKIYGQQGTEYIPQ